MKNSEKSVIDFWLALNLAQQSVIKDAEAALKAVDLPPLAWFEVLFELEFAKNGMRPFELQELLLFQQSNMSRLLRRMVDEGVVTEAKTNKDGRGKIMLSTKKGRELSRRMWSVYSPVLQSAHAAVAESINPDLMTKALHKLVDDKIVARFAIS